MMMRIFATLLVLLLGGGGGGGFLFSSSSIISVVESFPLSSSSITTRVGGGIPLSPSSSSLSFVKSRYDDKRNHDHHSTTSRRDRQQHFFLKERRSLSSSTTTSRLFGAKRMVAAKQASSATAGIATTILTTIWMKIQVILGSLTKFFCDILQWSSWLPRQKFVLAIVFVLGVILGTKITLPQTTRFVNAMDIPTKYFGENAPLLKGRVVNVSDGDTFRFYHRPTILHSTKFESKGPKKQKLSETTMPIRICTYDSPETPKFGKSGQPYGKEAKEKLESLLMNGIVKLRLLQKDQYGRAVAQVLAKGKNKGIDEIMLSEGLGEVYLGGGAVYGPLGKNAYLNIQQKAQKSKVGMWSLGTKRESAADYKRRTK